MSEAAPTSQLDFIERTVDVVAAYVSNNSLPSAELPALIASIHASRSAPTDWSASSTASRTRR